MSVIFLLLNWQVLMWKMGETKMICYLEIHYWIISLASVFGGNISEQNAIKAIVHSNQALFKIFL